MAWYAVYAVRVPAASVEDGEDAELCADDEFLAAVCWVRKHERVELADAPFYCNDREELVLLVFRVSKRCRLFRPNIQHR